MFHSWADSEALWKSMVCKEPDYKSNSSYMSRHPDLQPRMRSILLDWIMEVSGVVETRNCSNVFFEM